MGGHVAETVGHDEPKLDVGHDDRNDRSRCRNGRSRWAEIRIGASAFSGGLSALLLALVFLPVADRWYIPYEERLLAQAFGTAWEDYKRRVRRWL